MRTSALRWILAGAFAVLLCVGCDETQAPLAPPAPKKAAVAVAEATAVVEEPAAPVYIYDPTGTRDPFTNPLSILVDVSPETGVPLTPLQKLDIGQLRLIGIIVGKGEPRAMVIAPDGKSFILKKGIKVGKNSGVVVAITPDAVQVQEQFIDYAGEINKRIEEIKLPQQGGKQ